MIMWSKLVKYFSRQLSCKRKVALQERNAKLEGFPQLHHWFRIVDVRKEVMEEITPGQLSLEQLLEMTDEQVCETVEKYGANPEECARLNASLSCLRNVHMADSHRLLLASSEEISVHTFIRSFSEGLVKCLQMT
ncbi:kinase suppressor of Ras 2-like [Macrotis lagotis]|uniref:kinase suppressor of Ras 2-like n=1 Tax=Macrotis lagotis TaxID=92651 RepID=UPI003D69BF63